VIDLLTPSQSKNMRAATDGYGVGNRYGGSARLRDELSQYPRGGMFWPELWEVLRVAEEEVDWTQPAFLEIADRERVFGSFQAFYSEMVEPWMGEWRRLTERYRRYAEATTPEAKQHERKATAAEIMDGVAALPENEPPAEYGKKGGRGKKAVLARKAFSGGSDPAYLAARIKRDHPEIAAKVAAGDYASIREAAVAAGIVKPPSPLAQMRSAWKRASPEQQATFRREIAG
jgi:hypothetical protein